MRTRQWPGGKGLLKGVSNHSKSLHGPAENRQPSINRRWLRRNDTAQSRKEESFVRIKSDIQQMKMQNSIIIDFIQ